MSSPDGSTVTFRRAPADLRLRAIERFARKLEQEVARGRAFDCLVTGDAELRRLNHAAGAHLGDIAISLARARKQARDFGHTTEQEVRILMLHGLLHLLGMDHESDAGRMARAEKRWRVRLGLPNGLIERVRS